MGFWSQLALLTWKNWILLKRRTFATIFEIGVPLFFAFIFLKLRNDAKIEDHPLGIEFKMVPSLFIDHLNQPFPEKLKLGYVPDTKETKILMMHMAFYLNVAANQLATHQITIKGFDTENQAKKHSLLAKSRMPVVIVFHDVSASDSTLPKKLNVTLRPFTGVFDERSWQTRKMKGNEMPHQRLGQHPDYWTNNIALYQTMLAQGFLDYWDEKKGDNSTMAIALYLRPMAYPPFKNDPVIGLIQNYLPGYIMLSFIMSVIFNTKNLVYEKERKLKESMKLMGLHASVHWAAWFVTFALYLGSVLTAYAYLLSKNVMGTKPALAFVDSSLLCAFLLCYAFAMATFCFMVSSLVQKANLAAGVAGVLFFITLIPSESWAADFTTETRSTKLTGSLLLNSAMALGLKVISLYEKEGKILDWGNYNQPGDKDNVSLLNCMVMLLVDALWHCVVTWYLDNIWPGDFGVPEPYLFFLKKSYWKGPVEDEASFYEVENGDEKYFEPDPTDKHAGIKIAQLRKRFGKNVAVKGVSLSMYEGQITVLLGHNGAGKTTTMSMLTGFIPPSGGTALVNGYDIRTHIQGVRESLGLCPQHDILFDTLTVEEHLTFFAKLKGFYGPGLKEEVLKTVKDIGLETKIDTLSKSLSGGHKRKLSVGIALIGGSKIVILDEPTAGMDPAARRQTWTVLQRARKGRTIVLSTHYMDEADVLGDRVAIMADGVIKCCGSSMFLKKLYGAGYHLVVVRKPDCDIGKLTKVVKKHVKDAELETIVNTEISYLLPNDQVSRFSALFTELDNKMDKLDISGFGASATTMEEVFLKAGNVGNDYAMCSLVESDGTSGKTVSVTYDREKIESEGPTAESGATVESYKTNKSNKSNKSTKSNVSNKSASEHAKKIERRIRKAGSSVDMGPTPKMEIMSAVLEDIPSIKSESESVFSVQVSITDDQTSLVDSSLLNEVAKKLPDSKAPDFNMGFTQNSGLALYVSMFRALFVKKAINAWRSRWFTLLQLLLPIAFFYLATMKHRKVEQTAGDAGKLLSYDLKPFGRTYVPVTAGARSSSSSEKLASVYSKQFGKGHNVEKFNMPKPYDAYNKYTLKRAKQLGEYKFKKEMVIGMEVLAFDQDMVDAVACYNIMLYHSAPVSVSYLLNSILKFRLDDSYGIQYSLHLLPIDVDINHNYVRERKLAIGFVMSFLISFGMAFLTSMFIFFPIKERQSGAKHMQIVSGVGPVTFWLPAFVWDFLNYMIPSLVLLVMYAIDDLPAYTGGGRLNVVTLVMLLYGWAILPFMYTVQFLFKHPPSGLVVVLVVNIISGILTLTFVFILKLPGLGLSDVGDEYDWTFMAIFPNYIYASSLTTIYTNYEIYKECKNVTCKVETPNPCCKGNCGNHCMEYVDDIMSLDKPGIGYNLVYLALQGAFFFLLVILTEYHVFHRIWYILSCSSGYIYSPDAENVSSEDSDVAAEKMRINAFHNDVLKSKGPLRRSEIKDCLMLVNLHKRYVHFVAVDHLCLGVPNNECFGLLGQNGAGKTTTFKMLTGDVLVTSGNAYLKGYDICKNIKHVQARMGYCPQFDALQDNMTGRETLNMYARLRGVPEKNLNMVVDNLIDMLMLTPYADVMSGQYSGGNKRKLSTGMALVGDPPFIMLDEPSAGMDPKARRQLWNVLTKVRASGRTLVLTSHSMDEVQALCTRLAIMVNGQFVCMGSPQHLKNKFGQGYTLVVKMALLPNGRAAPNKPIIDYIRRDLKGSEVFDDHVGYVHFQVPSEGVKLAQIFSLMEKAKKYLNVEDYSVQQTTLEQIFLSFTRVQYMGKQEQGRVEQKFCSLLRKIGGRKK